MTSLPYLPTAPGFVRHLAAKFGDETLIVANDERISYREAEERSARLARGLIAQGIGKGSRVGLWLGNGPHWVLGWLAATRIGAIAIPLNTFFQRAELQWILRHADIQLLLTLPRFLTHDYLERLEAAVPGLAEAQGPPLRCPEVPNLRAIAVWGECDRAWALCADALEREHCEEIDEALLTGVEESVMPADPMVIMYSSGSTADPKGAIHTHGAVIRHSHRLNEVRDLLPGDRIWTPMPFFWVGGFVFALLGGLHVGATLVCEDAFDPATTLALLEREKVTVALGWPHFGKALAEHPDAKRRDLSALRAGNVPDLLPGDIVSRDPELRPNALGMTETLGPHTESGAGILPESRRGTLGPPVPRVQHKVVDPDTGAALPLTQLGELCVRGESVMQGLYKVEREDTFDADGYYHTGDAGCFTETGLLVFKGRLGEMIKTGGANVTPSEVEQVLAGFDEVKAAYVVGIPDEERGEAVACSVVLEPGRSADSDALRARLKQELSAYKVPRHLFLDDAATLPFTDTGKIDKRRLSALLARRVHAAD